MRCSPNRERKKKSPLTAVNNSWNLNLPVHWTQGETEHKACLFLKVIAKLIASMYEIDSKMTNIWFIDLHIICTYKYYYLKSAKYSLSWTLPVFDTLWWKWKLHELHITATAGFVAFKWLLVSYLLLGNQKEKCVFVFEWKKMGSLKNIRGLLVNILSFSVVLTPFFFN